MTEKFFLVRVQAPPGLVGLPPETYLCGELEAFAGALVAFHAKGGRALVSCSVVAARVEGDTAFLVKPGGEG